MGAGENMGWRTVGLEERELHAVQREGRLELVDGALPLVQLLAHLRRTADHTHTTRVHSQSPFTSNPSAQHSVNREECAEGPPREG